METPIKWVIQRHDDALIYLEYKQESNSFIIYADRLENLIGLSYKGWTTEFTSELYFISHEDAIKALNLYPYGTNIGTKETTC